MVHVPEQPLSDRLTVLLTALANAKMVAVNVTWSATIAAKVNAVIKLVMWCVQVSVMKVVMVVQVAVQLVGLISAVKRVLPYLPFHRKVADRECAAVAVVTVQLAALPVVPRPVSNRSVPTSATRQPAR